jgi:tetratricopeptide (TPR) repeat protein
MMLALLESDQTKGYVDSAIKSAVPTFVHFGLGFAVPFLSPLIIAASSNLVLKGLEFAGDKIEIAHEKLQQHQEDQGIKGFLAKMASPCLGTLKKILPVSEKELHDALTDSSKLKQFFAGIIEDPKKRNQFEESLKKFLTGNYADIEEFQRNVKETLGVSVDRLALEAYTQFTGIIYNSEILNKIIALSDSSEEDRSKIEDSVKEIHKNFEKKYNEIKDEIVRLRDVFYVSYGLYRLTPNYFEDYVDTKQDMEGWKDGFSFQLLSSIKENKEFRRDKIVEDIKKRLEEQHRQLIVGASGTSKSTVLMEIICDYYDEGYEILWNRGDTAIMNGMPIITFIEKLLNDGNKVLVAVDNVHDEKRSAIFFAMDQLSFHRRSENVRFILTARIPEYELLVDSQSQRLVQVQEEYRESIQRFRNDSNFKYEIPFFTKDEIKGFIRRYREEARSSAAREEKLFDEESEKIYNDTKGHPIMVKFSVFRDGLRNDVEKRYANYLIDPANKLPDASKIQTILVCSLLDISSLQITDELLSDMNIKKFAYRLRHALLYHYPDGTWKTIHPRWDIELLSFLYKTNIDDEDVVEERQGYLKNSIDSIFNINNVQITTSVIQMMYDIAAANIDGDLKIPIDIVENVIQNQMDTSEYLGNEIKSNLYASVIAFDYYKLQRYNDAVDKCGKALAIDPNNANALRLHGIFLNQVGRYEDAIKCCEKALEIDPNDFRSWSTKGSALRYLGKYEDAIKYYDKALEIDPNNLVAWLGKGITLIHLKSYEEAIACCDKAIERNSNNDMAWKSKVIFLKYLGRHEEADQLIRDRPNGF